MLYQVLWKYVFSRGKSKGIEVGVCSVGLENEH